MKKLNFIHIYSVGGKRLLFVKLTFMWGIKMKSIRILLVILLFIIGLVSCSKKESFSINSNLGQTESKAVSGSWASSAYVPQKTVDANGGQNNLSDFLVFNEPGKHYSVVVAGNDLVNDSNNDGSGNQISFPKTAYLDIPSGVTIEAVYLYYGGTIYYNQKDSDDPIEGYVVDDTYPDENFDLRNDSDVRGNVITYRIDNGSEFSVSPNLTSGSNDASYISWWKIWGKDGTLKNSKVAFYSNRIDITSQFIQKEGQVVDFSITNLQRYDLAGNQVNGGPEDANWQYPPPGEYPNGNGHAANDCAATAAFSVVVVYSEPVNPKPEARLFIKDGASFAWNNLFANGESWSYNPTAGPVVLDVEVDHGPVDQADITIGTMEGDPAYLEAPTQCGAVSSPYYRTHGAGQDYTWVEDEAGNSQAYVNIYEGAEAPNVGEDFTKYYNGSSYVSRPKYSYSNVTSIAKGLNFNVVNIALNSVMGEKTKLHFEGDQEQPTDKQQELIVVNYVILKAVQNVGGDTTAPHDVSIDYPTNGIEVSGIVTINATAEDNVGVTKVEFYYGATKIDEDAVSPYSINWNTAGVSNGSYNLTIKAYDAANNITISDSVQVTVNNSNGCQEFSATNYEHVQAGRAHVGGMMDLYTLANGSDEDMGLLGTVYYSTVTVLAETSTGYFVKGRCPQNPVADPEISPEGGSYSEAQSVRISTSTDDATIYYTLDGSSPTSSSLQYSEVINVESNLTIKAIAVKSGMVNSAVVSQTYEINIPKVASPDFDPAGGTYADPQNVELSSITEGAIIYYATDGSEPTTSSDVYISGQPIVVSDDMTIKAMAVKEGMASSDVSVAVYIIGSCVSYTDTNYNHINAGRAHAGGVMSLYALANGSGDDMGLVGTQWYSVATTLVEVAPGIYEIGTCN